MTEHEERCYMTGQRAVWREMFNRSLKELGIADKDLNAALLLCELEAVRAQLRILCEDFGDND